MPIKTSSKHKKHLSSVDPVLAEVIAVTTLEQRPARDNNFASLAYSIIGQQLSVKAAHSIRLRVTKLFRGNIFPSPKVFLKIPDEKLRAAGLSAAKVSYMRNLAEFFISHKKELSELESLDDETIITLLTEIKGIGRWTVEMFLMFTLGREDVFSHGDLGLRNAVAKLYKLRGKPSTKTLKRISDKWKPFRSHASLYLWASL